MKTIIFDLGGVVVNSLGLKLYDHCSKKLNIPVKKLAPVMEKYEPDLQIGKISHIQFWEKVIKDLKIETKTNLEKLWLDPYKKHVKINKNMIKLIQQLKKKYIVGCISNTQEPHNTYNKNRGLLKHFNPCILSSEVKLRKPNKRIFQLYLKKAKVKPSEAVFIDDEAKNMKQAKKLGMKTITFKNITQLKSELKKLNC